VPAQSAVISPFDALYTRMGASDDLQGGLSTFYLESAQAGRILREATERSLVIMDELGRGTSSSDGAAVAVAALRHLALRVRCNAMFITHYPEVWGAVDRIREQGGPGAAANAHMSFVEDEDEDENADEDEDEVQNDDEMDEAHGGEGVVKGSGRSRSRGRPRVGGVTFLFRVAAGAAHRSYGLSVARMAGIPPDVIQMAAERSAWFAEYGS